MGVQLDVHPVLLAPGEGETVTDRPERTLRILAELDDVIVTWFRYEPGEKGPDPHVHRRHTDAFFVLEGEVEFGLGPEVRRLTGTAGTFAAAPPNVVHTFRNSSDATAVFLNLHVPSLGFGNVLRGGGEEGFDQFDPPADGGRPFEDAVFSPGGEGELIENATGSRLIKGDLPQLSVLDLTFQPSFEGVDLHTHSDHVDVFYVLEGEIEFLDGAEARRGGPGTFFVAPRGTTHGFRNGGAEPFRFLNVHAPPGDFLDFVRRQA
jgi:quercetin dioxygenase-like cupin family protein